MDQELRGTQLQGTGRNESTQNELGSEDEREAQAREHVQAAAQILKSLGPDRTRIGWMLEDTLMYLDELRAQTTTVGTTQSALDELDKIARMANGSGS
ncbi:MAG: hypothetical protein KDD69_01310 [Bdellovibrionales bacterium]|nr:hypothetical protein [Bdellovibrionales bacterium]